MKHATLNAVTIGNAMVDIIASVEEDFLTEHHLTKASMMLVDDQRSAFLRSRLAPNVMSSGGSVANTSHGLASLGGRAGFIGKIADDDLGACSRATSTMPGCRSFPPPRTTGSPRDAA